MTFWDQQGGTVIGCDRDKIGLMDALQKLPASLGDRKLVRIDHNDEERFRAGLLAFSASLELLRKLSQDPADVTSMLEQAGHAWAQNAIDMLATACFQE